MKTQYGVPQDYIFKGPGKNIKLAEWYLDDDDDRVNITLVYERGIGFEPIKKSYNRTLQVLDDFFKMGIFNHTNGDIGLTMYEYSFIYSTGEFHCTHETAHDGSLMFDVIEIMFDRLFDKDCIKKETTDDGILHSRIQDIYSCAPEGFVRKKRRIH